ncbi:MAG TPA: hypothetical protein VNK95_05990 [Caldilineaceae bacterium]|nr:hypothetical protein [Caldilineaceae bacterium]
MPTLLILLLTAACRPIQAPNLPFGAAALPPGVASALAQLPIAQRAAASVEAATAESPFVTLYPALRQAPAPAWLRAGTRVTYRVGAATFADPRLPRTDRNTPNPTPSGEGLLQYDVVAQTRGNLVFVSSALNTQIPGQPPSLLSYGVGLPGAGEFWFSPLVLETAETAASEVFQVQRMPLTIEGVDYTVVRMQTNTEVRVGTWDPRDPRPGQGEEVWAFDTATGILVFYRQALFWPDGSQRSGITMSLLGQRRVQFPWRGGSVPDWVRPRVTLTFQGSQALDIGIPPLVPLSVQLNARITRVNTLWSEHTLQTIMSGDEIANSAGATGVMQLFSGLWLPPEALAGLEAGAVLDYDRLTQIETRVERASSRQVVLAAEGPGHLTRLTYDGRDGRLTGIYQEAHTPTGTLYTNLVGAP